MSEKERNLFEIVEIEALNPEKLNIRIPVRGYSEIAFENLDLEKIYQFQIFRDRISSIPLLSKFCNIVKGKVVVPLFENEKVEFFRTELYTSQPLPDDIILEKVWDKKGNTWVYKVLRIEFSPYKSFVYSLFMFDGGLRKEIITGTFEFTI